MLLSGSASATGEAPPWQGSASCARVAASPIAAIKKSTILLALVEKRGTSRFNRCFGRHHRVHRLAAEGLMSEKAERFSRYQILVTVLLTALQFTIILDFMILAPLGAILMPALHISTQQFGSAVSAYAFSAGLSGVLAAGFSDRFDRKRLLMFFYSGFLVGNLACGLAPTYPALVGARIITGLFGGVIGSVLFSIVADIFAMNQRGRVMGFVQGAFAVSQVLGLPLGLKLATAMNWHAPFLVMSGLGAMVLLVTTIGLRPLRAHLADGVARATNPFVHLSRVVSRANYLQAFAATTLLATGGFMLMPFGSAFSVGNLGIDVDHLSIVYAVTGLFTMIGSPLIGRLSDAIGKYPVFVTGSLLGAAIVLFYTRLGITPLWEVIAVNVALFLCITSRMISGQALMTAVPALEDRGAFMSINSAVAQLAGGIAANVAGHIVTERPGGGLAHYEVLGYVVACAMVVTVLMMRVIDRQVKEAPVVSGPPVPIES
jgi:predicted MFS family arabinose efflux permease